MFTAVLLNAKKHSKDPRKRRKTIVVTWFGHWISSWTWNRLLQKLLQWCNTIRKSEIRKPWKLKKRRFLQRRFIFVVMERKEKKSQLKTKSLHIYKNHVIPASSRSLPRLNVIEGVLCIYMLLGYLHPVFLRVYYIVVSVGEEKWESDYANAMCYVVFLSLARDSHSRFISEIYLIYRSNSQTQVWNCTRSLLWWENIVWERESEILEWITSRTNEYRYFCWSLLSMSESSAADISFHCDSDHSLSSLWSLIRLRRINQPDSDSFESGALFLTLRFSCDFEYNFG